jgi:LysM repeat protein
MTTATLCYNLCMNRRQLGFIVLVNAVVSLAIALAVVWAVDARRPDLEQLAALYTPAAQAAVAQAADPVVERAATAAPTVPAIQDTQATAAPASTLEPGEQQIYVVQVGDSLFAIAERFHVSADQIMAANQLKDPNLVYSGQRLKIPTKDSIIPSPVTPTVLSTPAELPTSVTPTTDTIAAPTASAGLQIETVDAPGNLLNEAILLVNNSNQAYNLQGWRLERQDGPAYAFGNVQLFQGSSIWVHSSDGADTSIALYWKQSNPVWQSGALARLVNAQGEQVASYTIP